MSHSSSEAKWTLLGTGLVIIFPSTPSVSYILCLCPNSSKKPLQTAPTTGPAPHLNSQGSPDPGPGHGLLATLLRQDRMPQLGSARGNSRVAKVYFQFPGSPAPLPSGSLSLSYIQIPHGLKPHSCSRVRDPRVDPG